MDECDTLPTYIASKSASNYIAYICAEHNHIVIRNDLGRCMYAEKRGMEKGVWKKGVWKKGMGTCSVCYTCSVCVMS